MSCVAANPKFRLLDHLAGWDEADTSGLTGLYDGEGLRLIGNDSGITAGQINPYIPPPRLAPGCDPCEWYLATKPGPTSQLLKMNGCNNLWSNIQRGSCFPLVLNDVVAVAIDRHVLALADAGVDRVWLLHMPHWQITGEIEVKRPVDLAFGPEQNLTIVAESGSSIQVVSRNGRSLGTWPGSLPPEPIARIAYDRDGLLWLVTRKNAEYFKLYRQRSKESGEFVSAGLEALSSAFNFLPVLLSSRTGFCLSRGGEDGSDRPFCYDWFGRPYEIENSLDLIGADSFSTQGQLLTGAIDSGEPRCRWHRIRIDADIPVGTRLEVAVATSEDANPAPQGMTSASWSGFPPGVPHPGDWQELGPGEMDALIRQMVGRYLFLRVRLTGDGIATPRVKRIHIDFPRNTSADLLPAIYRDEPEASDFTERFLALFDAGIEGIEQAVERFPALLDTRHAPADILPWIAKFLGLTLDESWNAETRRRVLAGAPELFRKRGTVAGLRRAIELVYGSDIAPAITEHGHARSWAAVAGGNGSQRSQGRLGQIRLFSKKNSRMMLGRSPIGSTPVMSFGNPETDVHMSGAFRFTVAVPPRATNEKAALVRLVEGQKPGHSIAHIREGGTSGFLLGQTLQLGIDTVIRRRRPQALGDPELRLGRRSVLGGIPPPGPIVGRSPLTSPTSCTE